MELCNHLQITKQSFADIRNAKAVKPFRINRRLFQIADYFGCQIDALINPQVREEMRDK
jgi:hypothetical protein